MPSRHRLHRAPQEPVVSDLAIIRRDHGVLEVAGEIDMASSDQFARALRSVATSNTDELDVDLSRVTFMDSSGLHVLLDAHMALAAGGCRLVVLRPSRAVRRLLEIGGVDGLLLREPDINLR